MPSGTDVFAPRPPPQTLTLQITMLSVAITVVVSLILSAFFSGMEIAFLSSNKLKLEIERKRSRLFGYIAGLFAKYPGQYITTILVGNNVALVVY